MGASSLRWPEMRFPPVNLWVLAQLPKAAIPAAPRRRKERYLCADGLSMLYMMRSRQCL